MMRIIYLSSMTIMVFFMSFMISRDYATDKSHHRSLRSLDSTLKDNKLAFIALPHEDNMHMAIAGNQKKNESPKSSTILTTRNDHTMRSVRDSICTGCRYVYTSNEENEGRTTCWNEIEQMLSLNKNNMSTSEAAINVSSLYPNNCQRCNPNSCTNDEKRYYRPDDHEIISDQYIGYARTHYLQSIDTNDRIPSDLLASPDGLDAYLSNSSNLYPNREYFAEFNPSITHLPKSQIPMQLLSLLESDDTDESFYLASYRVSTAQHCFRDSDNYKLYRYKGKILNSSDYLGIAILDINLHILIETVVDIRSVLTSTIPGMNSDELYQDGRLFTLNDQLYLGSYTGLYPIWLVPPMKTNNNNINELEDIAQMPYYMTAEHKVNRRNDNNNSNLLNVYIQRSGFCSNDKKHQRYGKSYNYFYDENKQRIVLEIFPMGEKEYIDTNCQLSDKKIDFIKPNKPIPFDSYSTTDEMILAHNHQMELPFSADRGNTCCLPINEPQYYYPKHKDQKKLLLGISHIQSKANRDVRSLKIVNKYMYFHNFYIMESVEPYNVVARSGRFCLGRPKYEHERNNITNTYDNNYDDTDIHFMHPDFKKKYKFGNELYDCSAVHFITGMTEALHDPNQVIISYGADDCYARFIMISKERILSLLFNNNDPTKQ